jgi:hypothetical protein
LPQLPPRCRRHPTANEVGRESRKAIVLTFCPAILDFNVLTFAVAAFLEAAVECRDDVGGLGRRSAAEEPNSRHRRLLRARPERPRCRTAEQRDECAPLHSITSSAVASSACSTLRPRTFAVCRLMTNSNLAARITGSSAAFSPLRMRPV